VITRGTQHYALSKAGAWARWGPPWWDWGLDRDAAMKVCASQWPNGTAVAGQRCCVHTLGRLRPARGPPGLCCGTRDFPRALFNWRKSRQGCWPI